MLELEFIDSPDKDVLGKRVLYFDDISMGRSRSNVIIVDDPDMEPRDVRLSVVESGVFVENVESDCYFSNDKKVFGKKFHSQGAQVRVGNTTFKIVSFKKLEPKMEDYDLIYERDIQPHPHKDQFFYAIEKEMDELEGS